MICSTLYSKGGVEEIALIIDGKKKNLTFNTLIDYFGKQRCQIPDKIIDRTLDNIKNAIPQWIQLIEISFLSDEIALIQLI